jgi:hypothetical protein
MAINTNNNPSSINIPKFEETHSSTPSVKSADRFLEFFTNAQACFVEINKIGHQGTGQKKQHYKELRGSIKEALKNKPEVKAENKPDAKDAALLETISKLEGLSKQVKIAKNKLDSTYETNSIWLMMTMNKTHFKQITPGETKLSPENFDSVLKVNPDNLPITFININKLQKPESKLRALLELIYLIEVKLEELEQKKDVKLSPEEESTLKVQIADYSMRLETVEAFAKTCVSFKELFESITELKDKAISDLVDFTGKHHALYLLMPSVALMKPNIPFDQRAAYLINLLTMLVKDRFDKNPTRTPLGYLYGWPKSKEVLQHYPAYSDKVFQKKIVAAILSVQGNPKKGDPRPMVCEYLLNLFDPTGALRLEVFQKKGLPLFKMCSQVAKTRHSLVKFGYTATQLESLPIQTSSKTKAPQIIAKDFIQHITAGDFKEIEYVANLLKNHAVRVYKSVTPSNFLDTFGVSCLGIARQFGEKKLISWLFAALRSCKTEKEQIYLYKAVLMLVRALVLQGEFTISLILKQNFLEDIDNKKLYLKAWKSVESTKEFVFLEKLFDPISNNKNLNKFIAEKLKKVACLPYFGTIPKSIFMMKQGLENLLGQLKDQLKDLLKDKMDGFYILLGKKYLESSPQSKKKPSDEDLIALGKNNLTVNFEILLETLKKHNNDLYEASIGTLLPTIRQAVEQQQMLLDFSSHILEDLWTLHYLHNRDFWQTLDKQSDLIQTIENQVVLVSDDE